MTAHFSGLVQTPHENVVRLNYICSTHAFLHIEMMRSCKYNPHVSRIPTLPSNWMSSVVVNLKRQRCVQYI